MKNRLISAGMTLFLIFILFFTVFLSASGVYLGPYLKNYSQDMEIYHQMMEKIGVTDSEYLGSYNLNETVYISEIKNRNGQYYLWYNDQLETLAKKETDTYHENEVLKTADELNINEYSIEFGWYKNRPMIVLDNDEIEILLDYDSLEVQLTYKKEVVY